MISNVMLLKLLLNATVVHADDLDNHINENEYQVN